MSFTKDSSQTPVYLYFGQRKKWYSKIEKEITTLGTVYYLVTNSVANTFASFSRDSLRNCTLKKQYSEQLWIDHHIPHRTREKWILQSGHKVPTWCGRNSSGLSTYNFTCLTFTPHMIQNKLGDLNHRNKKVTSSKHYIFVWEKDSRLTKALKL